ARNGDFGQLCTGWGGTFTGPGGTCAGASNVPTGVTTQLVDPKNGNPIPNNDLAAYIASPANTAGLAESAVAKALFGMTKYYPVPQINTLNAANYFYNSGNNLNNNQGDLKIDYLPSQRDRVFGRWSQMDLHQPTFTGCVFCNSGAAEGSDEPVRNAVVDWTHTFTPGLLNEARVGFNAVRFDQSLTPTSSLGNISEQLGITGGNFQAPGLLQLNIQGNNVPAGYAALGLQNLVQIFHSTEGQIEDNLVLTHGRHQIKAGFQFVRQRQDFVYPGNNGALGFLGIDTATGSGLADFYLGDVAPGAGASLRDTGGQVSSPAKLRGNMFGVFAQDDWRVTNTLTVNIGLRFEDHTPFYELNDRVVNFGLYTGTINTADGRSGTAKF